VSGQTPDDDFDRGRPGRGDLEEILRERRARVRICAWCDAVFVEGTWYAKTELMTFAWRLDPRASHTICPTCFSARLPGVAYPGG
jgi:hypothetical protein